MLIIGAKGHAKEVLDILHEDNLTSLLFFDDVSTDLPDKLFGLFTIITNEDEVVKVFSVDNSFTLGIGGTIVRSNLYNKMLLLGGEPVSVISKNALIGKFNVRLGDGLNIMHKVFISSDVSIGLGSLINEGCAIHHDSSIGDFCEICPGVTITGGVSIGNFVYIGSGAIILPKLKIGNNVTIGAGAVVTQSVEDNMLVIGIPARAQYKN